MEIDVVILWVDGADPAWQTEKRRFLPPAHTDSDSPNRYRDWGLLPYWFRGLERFAPWVRKVHFVTWGHVPAFLDPRAPKLHIVRHDAFIPEEYLPTFSSHTIELNIHRIPDLAEHFIYFNDDMFLLKPRKPEDFFRDGLPCTCGSEVPWQFRGTVGIWGHAVANDLGIINRHFPKRQALYNHGRKYLDRRYRWQDYLRTLCLHILFPDYFTGFRNLHAPAAYRKQTFQEVWNAEPELLHNTCRDKFRSPGNVNQWLFLWWQVASGQFAPGVVDNRTADISEETIAHLCQCIEHPRNAMLCLNDPAETLAFEDLSLRLQRSFETILPDKSSFEL